MPPNKIEEHESDEEAGTQPCDSLHNLGYRPLGTLSLNETHNRNRRTDVAYTYVDSALELARAVDILMVIVPGAEDTRNLVDAEILRALGPEGVLLNCSRGTVVDEKALIAALRNKVIATEAMASARLVLAHLKAGRSEER